MIYTDATDQVLAVLDDFKIAAFENDEQYEALANAIRKAIAMRVRPGMADPLQDPGVQGLAQLGRNAIERTSSLERTIAALQMRLRRSGQLLIEEIGACGPESADDTADRYEIDMKSNYVQVRLPSEFPRMFRLYFAETEDCVGRRIAGAIRQQTRDLEIRNEWYANALNELDDKRSEITKLRADLAAAVAKRDEWAGGAAQLSSQLGNLLAVIHRDGGHYEAEHGTEKASDDAITAVHVLRGSLEGYVEANRYMKGELDDALEDARKYAEAQREIARLRHEVAMLCGYDSADEMDAATGMRK